jgi:hypothetical protein
MWPFTRNVTLFTKKPAPLPVQPLSRCETLLKPFTVTQFNELMALADSWSEQHELKRFCATHSYAPTREIRPLKPPFNLRMCDFLFKALDEIEQEFPISKSFILLLAEYRLERYFWTLSDTRWSLQEFREIGAPTTDLSKRIDRVLLMKTTFEKVRKDFYLFLRDSQGYVRGPIDEAITEHMALRKAKALLSGESYSTEGEALLAFDLYRVLSKHVCEVVRFLMDDTLICEILQTSDEEFVTHLDKLDRFSAEIAERLKNAEQELAVPKP